MKKKFWKSKTFWSGALSIANGIHLVAIGNVNEGAVAIVAGIVTILGRSTAEQKLGL